MKKIRPTAGTRREHTIALKAGVLEWTALEQAAKECDMNVSFFIINAALRRACEVLDNKKGLNDIVSKVKPLIIKEDK
jgi:uncharacterized protein (DUF1778 family)